MICWLITDYFLWRYLSAFESPLDCKEIQPVHSKGAQSWVFIGRTGAEAETPILWPPQAKSWLIGKDSDAGRDWEQEEKGMTEDEMAGWHHRLDGHESEQTPEDTGRRRGLERSVHGSQRVGHNWATELNWQFSVRTLEVWVYRRADISVYKHEKWNNMNSEINGIRESYRFRKQKKVRRTGTRSQQCYFHCLLFFFSFNFILFLNFT